MAELNKQIYDDFWKRNEKNKSIISSFKEIFNKSRSFIIPDFQRDFVWKREDADLFLNSLVEHVESGINFFAGTILIKKNEYNFDLIDGQQRFTILFIILVAIFWSVEDEEIKEGIKKVLVTEDRGDNINLILRYEDKTNDLLLLLEKELDLSKYRNEDIIKTYNNIQKEISTNFSEEKKKRLAEIIYNIEFNIIKLKEESDPYLAFESLNSTGVSLTTSELIRNFAFLKTKGFTINNFNQTKKNKFEKALSILDLEPKKRKKLNIESVKLWEIFWDTFYFRDKYSLHLKMAKHFPKDPKKVFIMLKSAINKEDNNVFIDNIIKFSEIYDKYDKFNSNSSEYENTFVKLKNVLQSKQLASFFISRVINKNRSINIRNILKDKDNSLLIEQLEKSFFMGHFIGYSWNNIHKHKVETQSLLSNGEEFKETPLHKEIWSLNKTKVREKINDDKDFAVKYQSILRSLFVAIENEKTNNLFINTWEVKEKREKWTIDHIICKKKVEDNIKYLDSKFKSKGGSDYFYDNLLNDLSNLTIAYDSFGNESFTEKRNKYDSKITLSSDLINSNLNITFMKARKKKLVDEILKYLYE